MGREAERSVVTEVLGAAAAGAPGAVLVVGDPGTGKTRLVDDALTTAAAAGLVSAVGRCSQDDGAPPLWPWYALLDGLGIDRPAELDRAADGADIGPERAFAVQDALARAVRDRARDQPVLLVVEDLHWADTRTLRALTHLVTTLRAGDRVALLATRRARPQPAGALADLGVALARHGARTIELGGLGEDDARALVASVTGADADPDRVDDWRTRTGGNPFFLVELARLATTTDGWRGEVPESVQTVVARRLADLPDPTREVLLVSAALGREHSPLLLAHVGGWGPDEVTDRLEPAQEVGIVHQRADGRLVFEHALTRDAVIAAASPARVARVHARIAHALDTVPRGSLAPAERAFDLAHHWLAAGPVHAPQAWRAAAAAAAEARRDFANVEAAELYRQALEAHALDPAGTREERYDLLLSFCEAAAWAAKWRPVVEAVAEAVALASADDDPERVAAGGGRPDPLLRVAPAGVRRGRRGRHRRPALGPARPGPPRLPGALRADARAGRAALLPQRVGAGGARARRRGRRAARRIGDPALRAWAARTGWIALWRSAHLERRHELAVEELAAARESGNEAAEALAHTALAGTALEEGDLETWEAESAAADDIARRRRLTYVEYALHFVRLSLSLAGRRRGGGRRARRRDAHHARGHGDPGHGVERVRGALRHGDAGGPGRPSRSRAACSSTTGRRRTTTSAAPRCCTCSPSPGWRTSCAPSSPERRCSPLHDDWFVTTEASVRALVAGYVGDQAMARQCVELLGPLSGRMAVSGISVVIGPVDGYVGDRPGHARRARGGHRVRRAGGGAGEPLGDDGLPAAGSPGERNRLRVLATARPRTGSRAPGAHASCSRTGCGVTTACSWSRSGLGLRLRAGRHGRRSGRPAPRPARNGDGRGRAAPGTARRRGRTSPRGRPRAGRAWPTRR